MIILASQSPYRKVLLEKTPYAFKAESPGVDEESLKNSFSGSAKDLIRFLAFKKAESLKNKFIDDVVIGSDQALILDELVIGKSHNYEGAKKQLLMLSEKKVELVTSVCILSHSKKIEFTNTAKLYFRKLSEDLVDWYLKKDEPYDCAGSFKIESAGAVLFKSVENDDPTAIQGLPVMRLAQELEQLIK